MYNANAIVRYMYMYMYNSNAIVRYSMYMYMYNANAIVRYMYMYQSEIISKKSYMCLLKNLCGLKFSYKIILLCSK